MSHEYSMVPLENPGELVEFPTSQQRGPEQEVISPLRRFMTAMHGRWIWGIMLGAILAVAGGAAGYFLPTPIYQANSLIGVDLWTTGTIMPNEETPGSRPLNQVPEYISQESQRIQTDAVVNTALNSALWTNNGDPGRTADRFMATLDVRELKSSILVSYMDPDPDISLAGVRAVVDAYMALYGSGFNKETTEQITLLTKRRDNITDELRRERNLRRSTAESNQYGTDDLRTFIDAKQQQVIALQAQLADINRYIASMPQETDAPAVTEGQAQDAPLVSSAVAKSPEEWALIDGRARDYLERVRNAEQTLAMVTKQQGENHRDTKRARDTLDYSKQNLANHIASLNEFGQPGATGGTMTTDPEKLAARQAEISALHDEATKQLKAMQVMQNEFETSRLNEEAIVVRLQEVSRRLDMLQFEQQRNIKRIEVINPGRRPNEPLTDRTKMATVAGIFGGGTFGIGLVLIIGLLDSRLRSIRDAEDNLSSISMLGILPMLPEDPSEPEQARLTAHAVHQIRTVLQIGGGSDSGRVLTVTSANPLDGKTSLTLALGMSFAASGARTIIVDCDLVRGGLSERVGAIQRRRIGQVLRRQQLVTEQQIEQALRIAQESGSMLGEVLIELGHVSKEDLDSALRIQEGMTVGLVEALNGEPLEACVASTGFDNLFILPLGQHELHQAFRLSPRSIRELFEQLRLHYDVVLVDTGPVPASIEAAHAAVASDGVVLVVSRGEQRQHVEQAITRLTSLGATLQGIVFNRAGANDLRNLAESSASRSSIDNQSELRHDHKAANRAAKLGPIARTVAGWSGNGSDDHEHSNRS